MGYQDFMSALRMQPQGNGYSQDNPFAPSQGGGDSMPQTNEFSRLLPNSPRLANALGNAALLAGSIPTGMTAGQNIANVAGAVSNLPYLRLMHQYQMYQPQLQTQELMSKLGLEHAQTQEALARGSQLSNENQMRLLAAQQRGELSAQIRVGSGKPTFGAGLLPADYNGPLGKPGETAYGNYFTDWDESKGMPTKRFEPTHTKEEGEQLNTMGMMKTMPQWMFGVSSIMQAHPEMTPDQAMKVYQSQSGLTLLGAHNTAPESEGEKEKTSAATKQKADEDVLKSASYTNEDFSKDAIRREANLRAAADDKFDRFGAGPAQIEQERRATNAQLSNLWSRHQNLPNNGKTARPSFNDYLTQHGWNPQTRQFEKKAYQQNGQWYDAFTEQPISTAK